MSYYGIRAMDKHVRITDAVGAIVLEFRHCDPSGAACTLEDIFYDLRRDAADDAITDYLYTEGIGDSLHPD